jgi:hypothetical protein
MKKIDLGTLINAEMYYKFKEKEKENKNSNTLQQTDNVNAPSALFCPSGLSGPLSGKDVLRDSVCGPLGGNGSIAQNQPISTKPGFVRLDPHTNYTRIAIQIGNIRESARYSRANIYISLQPDNLQKYNTFLTGAATNSKSELYRGCRSGNHVKNIIDDMFARYKKIMIARLRYKPVSGYITDFHKPLTKAAVVGITIIDDVFTAIFNLYNTEYIIPLDDILSIKQKKYYEAQGTYSEVIELDDEVA